MSKLFADVDYSKMTLGELGCLIDKKKARLADIDRALEGFATEKPKLESTLKEVAAELRKRLGDAPAEASPVAEIRETSFDDLAREAAEDMKKVAIGNGLDQKPETD